VHTGVFTLKSASSASCSLPQPISVAKGTSRALRWPRSAPDPPPHTRTLGLRSGDANAAATADEDEDKEEQEEEEEEEGGGGDEGDEDDEEEDDEEAASEAAVAFPSSSSQGRR